jgi:hypothetical protein
MINPFAKVKIFHIASMARSGETVFLRSLAAHTRICVVHNLEAKDAEHSAQLFEFLKHYPERKIKCRHPYVRPYKVLPSDVLVLKQGVWEHRFPFDGIILSRNPAAIYASLRNYDANGAEDDLDKLWHNNEKRFARWMRDIDASLVDEMLALPAVEQFCFFYNRRMGALADLGLPVVHYENFVTNPEKVLAVTVNAMGLDYEGCMLNAHSGYSRNAKGHGKIDMGAPLHSGSLYKFQKTVTPKEFDVIVEQTKDVHRKFGYQIEWDSIKTRPV